MAKLSFVDTHIHFWDQQNPDLHYDMLMPDYEHPIIGPRFEKLRDFNYLADDYISETTKANVTKAIHVQAAVGIDDPVKETAWLQAASDRTGFPQAIVAHSDLRDSRVEDELERHTRHPNVRGIRDFSYGDYLVEPEFHRGFALLKRFNLAASMDVKWEEMHKLRDLGGKFPDTPIVLDHCGFPTARTDEYFSNWRRALTDLARAENVVCKISGLGMCDHDWSTESIRPWVLHCIEAFGTERCVFGTNWPVDKLFSTYDAVIDAYAEIIGDFSNDEQVAMFSGNAESLYGI